MTANPHYTPGVQAPVSALDLQSHADHAFQTTASQYVKLVSHQRALHTTQPSLLPPVLTNTGKALDNWLRSGDTHLCLNYM
jgi:hypothetical protein